MFEIRTLSTEYVKVPVTAKKAGVAYDPSSDTVKMTFSLTEHLGVAPTWYAASWEDMTGGHMARCLVGPSPGVVQLAAGTYNVFVQISDNPEIPVLRAGAITVY